MNKIMPYYCVAVVIVVFINVILFLTDKDKNGNLKWNHLIVAFLFGILAYPCKYLI